jgi:benzil reductase ((S)-benzoin forming)
MVSVFKETDFSGVSSVTLINNAGTLSPIGPVQGLEQGGIISNTNVNFMTPIVLTSLFIREFQEFSGDKRVVNISSGAAMTAYEGWSLYCASKAGLEQFTRCVAKEQERWDAGVLIINFNPGVMDTDMQATIRKASEQQFPARQRFVDLHKNQVLMDPDIVAACLLRGLEVGDLVSGETYGLADFNCLGPA